jgi:predicted ATPase
MHTVLARTRHFGSHSVPPMLQRLYVHNFRCLENFELRLAQIPSALLIGKNGAGKSTLARALKIFQAIGRGVSRVGEFVKPTDFTNGRAATPMRFELEAQLAGKLFRYTLALELPDRFRELRVLEERLEVDGLPVYGRAQAQVQIHRNASERMDATFNIDWHLVALPVIQDQTIANPLAEFRQWLSRMVILAPIPQLMTGESRRETLEPVENGSNFADWLIGVLAQYPASYIYINDYLKFVMPDIADFKNSILGKDAKALEIRFSSGKAQIELSFDDLSDGEKCTFLCALVLAANKTYGPLFVFWDEPDNYLSLSEVGQFIVGLRRGFEATGQIIVTSHNEETIRSFSAENTLILSRKCHLEPTLIRLLSEKGDQQNVVQALMLGELEA